MPTGKRRDRKTVRFRKTHSRRGPVPSPLLNLNRCSHHPNGVEKGGTPKITASGIDSEEFAGLRAATAHLLPGCGATAWVLPRVQSTGRRHDWITPTSDVRARSWSVRTSPATMCRPRWDAWYIDGLDDRVVGFPGAGHHPGAGRLVPTRTSAERVHAGISRCRRCPCGSPIVMKPWVVFRCHRRHARSPRRYHRSWLRCPRPPEGTDSRGIGEGVRWWRLPSRYGHPTGGHGTGR